LTARSCDIFILKLKRGLLFKRNIGENISIILNEIYCPIQAGGVKENL